MKSAWEMARELFLQARPIVRSSEEQNWEDSLDVSAFYLKLGEKTLTSVMG
jgi:hypothetical protein